MMLKRLQRRWKRNLLTSVAIAVSFAMVLSLSSISLGLQRASEERFKESPRDIVISSTGLVPSIEDSHDLAYGLREDENISASMPILTILGRLSFVRSEERSEPWADPPKGFISVGDLETETVGIVGVVPELTSDFMSDGNELFIRSDILRFKEWFEHEDDPFYKGNFRDGWTGEILLDMTLMKEKHLSKGDIVYYISENSSISSSFIVVGSIETSLIGNGLAADLFGGIAVVHLSELQYASGNHEVITPEGKRDDLSTAIYIDLEREMLSSSDQRRISLELSKQFPGLDVTSKESRLYRIEEEVMILEVFSVSVALSSIFIGVLFLSSIMMIEVEERRSEISIMRSIGISRRTIFMQIVKDSLFLAFIGAMIGLLPGYFGSKLLDLYLQGLYGIRIGFARFEPFMVIGSLIYLFLLVALFSLIPAIRATTVAPRVGMASHYNR
ncbi:MAG: ABC transporter permease [Candidatus Thermoplasmatota archaeon]|nr:ABC transporter permease [Candidatus Thermoplasmatota archaeon]